MEGLLFIDESCSGDLRLDGLICHNSTLKGKAHGIINESEVKDLNKTNILAKV